MADATDTRTRRNVLVFAAGRPRHAAGKHPKVESLLHLIASHYGVPVEQLLSRSRGRAPVAHARQVAMYLCSVALGVQLATVSRLFGRDRSTAAHACARIEDMRDSDAFDAEMTMLEERLTAPAEGNTEVRRAAV